MRDVVIDVDFEKHGFVALEDTTSAPPGALRIMRNAEITDRGGLAPRPGTLLLGTANTNANPIRGFYNFRKSLGTDELLVKCYDDEIEFISKRYPDAGWTRLKNGFTVAGEFGFATALVNTDNQDYLIGCNRYEPYFRWTGAVAQLTAALVGGETSVTVDSTLLSDTYESKTATSSSATTLDVSTVTWASSQWVNFYVYITSGVLSGQVRKITANTATQITFDTLGSDPGLCTFQIKQLAFPASGTIIYGGTTIAYSAIPSATTFTVVSAHAAADDSLVTLVPTEYPAAPRGNRITNYLGRIIVGNVRSALARDSGGALQGFAAAGSVFVSKILTPTDFSYSATRVAGEGDIIAMPYGGGDITDVQYQEDTFYVLKGRYVEAVKYSQDSNDLAVREPLKTGIGSVGKTIKGADDIYFITPDKQITTIGRVKLKDIKPQTLDIGNRIKRYLETCNMDDIGRGMEIGDKVFFPLKSSDDVDQNDVLLVYNRNSRIFEGIWDIGAFGLDFWNEKYYYASSINANVHQLFYQHADVEGDTRYPIDFEVRSHEMNLTASKAYLQSMHGIVIEGYVAGGAEFDTKVWGDFANTPFLEFHFEFGETGFLDAEQSTAFLGGQPLALDPLGISFSDPDADGRRHFSFRMYFPFQYKNYYSVGFSETEADNDFEIMRVGLIMSEDPSVDTRRIKSI